MCGSMQDLCTDINTVSVLETRLEQSSLENLTCLDL